MDWVKWVNASGFRASWQSAFMGLQTLFSEAGFDIHKPIAKEERRSWWLGIEKPIPGIHRISAEMPRDVTPIRIYLRVWIYQDDAPDFAASMKAAPFAFEGVALSQSLNESPPDNWAAQLRTKGIVIRGVRSLVTLQDLRGFDERNAFSRVREIVETFCQYAIDHAALVERITPARIARKAALPLLESHNMPVSEESEVSDSQLGSVVEELSATVQDILNIEHDPRFQGVDPPTKIILANARLGQGGYRKRMLALWAGRCALTGCEVEYVLIASHARAWAECEGARDCLDEYNGLLLVANVDRLFDRGLISFSDDGSLLVKSGFDLDALLSSRKLRFLDDRHRPYLQWHRMRHEFEQA